MMSSSIATRPVTGLPDYAGEGIYLHIRGERYIDCASGTFNVSLGYSAPEIIDALHAQLDRIAHLSSDLTRAKSAEIFELMRPTCPPTSVLSGSGTSPVPVRPRPRSESRRSDRPSDIFSLFLSHHGQTATATGVSGNAFRQRSFSLPFAHSVKIPGPDCANCFYGQVPGIAR